MELSEKSWLAKFYKVSFGTIELPQSLCPYFWGLVLTFVLIPLTLPFMVGCRIFAKNWGNNFDVWVKVILGICFWGLITLLITSPVKTGIGIGFSVLAIGGSIGILILIDYLADSKTPEPILIVKESWKGFIGKYCPRITWKK